MPIPKFKPVANASEGSKKIIKPILIGLLAILAGAFGLEATNSDWDLGKIVKDLPHLTPRFCAIRRGTSGEMRAARSSHG